MMITPVILLLAYDLILYIARQIHLYEYTRWFIKGLLNLKVSKELQIDDETTIDEDDDDENDNEGLNEGFNEDGSEIYDDGRIRFTSCLSPIENIDSHTGNKQSVLYQNVVSH